MCVSRRGRLEGPCHSAKVQIGICSYIPGNEGLDSTVPQDLAETEHLGLM